MTFTEIIAAVAGQLNLTSAEALERIGAEVNQRYREVCSGVGLKTSVLTSDVTADTVIGSDEVTFNVEKLFSVFNPAYDPPLVLGERTIDYLRNAVPGTDPAQLYAIKAMGASSVTIRLNSVAESVYTLGCDAEVNLTDMVGPETPNFSADFHDILVRGAVADELEKMEKYDKADKQEAKYEKRLSELRYFIAKSAYKNIYQGARANGVFPWRQ